MDHEANDYELLGPLDRPRVEVRFDGLFDGAPVRWHATLIALPPGTPRFIEVGAARAGVRPVRAGLDVPLIDRPTLLKALVMLRRYKRLQEGRHEFGCVPGADRTRGGGPAP